MKNLVVEILEKNEESIKVLEKKIENGGNKKSIESVICGIRKNNEPLSFPVLLSITSLWPRAGGHFFVYRMTSCMFAG